MPQPPDTPSPTARRRAALLGGAALGGLAVAVVVAGAVWMAARPALILVEDRAARDHTAAMAALRLAEAVGRLAVATPPLADARTGTVRLAARAELHGQARDVSSLATEVAQSGLHRATIEGLRRPLSGLGGEIEELDRAVEARIATEAELHNALTQVPERHAALRAALAPLAREALADGPRAAALLSARDGIAERAQRLADRLLAGGDADAFRADARALEGQLDQLPIGPASVARAEAARQLMAFGLDPGNVFELRQELARLNGLIAERARVGRAKAEEVSQLARRAADGIGDAAGTVRANAAALLRAAPVLAATLAGVAVLVAGVRRRAEPSPAESGAAPADDAPGGLRVLLAEDERMTQAVAAALLRRAGHAVTVVDDGRAALEAVRAQPFDLVLLDLRMPEMDGIEALRRIRALPDRAQAAVRVVVLTASALPEDADRCRAAGADAVLAKPLRLDALLPVLDGRAAPDAAEGPPVFDPTALDPMLDALPPPRVAALIGSTLKALGDYRETLRAAWAAGDRSAAGAMAHKVAGVAGVYGCLALRQAAQALERAVEAGDGDPAALMDALEAAYGPALAALEREQRLLPAAPPVAD
ncbi:response regulator [Azospirillum sp.]|uniref:response regulator n=1 Tax=Azospirillum sp. TaxID=34012 RepID=UPI003D714B5A